MPMFDYKCDCGQELTDELVRASDVDTHKPTCPNCGKHMVRKVSLAVPHVFPSDGIFLMDVSPTGKTFYSKQEMRDWEKQTGGYIDCCH